MHVRIKHRPLPAKMLPVDIILLQLSLKRDKVYSQKKKKKKSYTVFQKTLLYIQ